MDEKFTQKRYKIYMSRNETMFGGHVNFTVREPKLVVSANNKGEHVRKTLVSYFYFFKMLNSITFENRSTFLSNVFVRP